MSQKFLEIEYKYRGGSLDKMKFINLCKRMRPNQYINVTGPDTYYKNTEGKVLRWRHNENLDELTVKQRLDANSPLYRYEDEIECSQTHGERTPVKKILRFIKALGFSKLFRINKECDIFWFRNKKTDRTVQVVFYTVYKRNRRDRHFVEIEVDKGQNITKEEAKELIVEFEGKLGLKPSQRLYNTLLELYSEETTELYDNKAVQAK